MNILGITPSLRPSNSSQLLLVRLADIHDFPLPDACSVGRYSTSRYQLMHKILLSIIYIPVALVLKENVHS